MKHNKKIIISILFVIVLSLSIYGCDKKNQTTPTPKPSENKTEKATYDENETIAYFSNFGSCSSGYGLSFQGKKTLNYSDLPSTIVNNTLYNYLKYSKKVESNNVLINETTEDNPKISKFSKSDLEAAIKHLYGNVEYDMSSTLELGDYSFQYDGSKDFVYENTSIVSCGNKKLDAYSVNSIYEEDNKLYVNIIYYNQEYKMNNKGYTRVIYGTNDNEKFENPDYYFLNNHQEHFLRYLFVFVPNNGIYVFDHVELIK